MKTVVTIDGPAGSGKSTVAKLFAEKHDLKQIDSGALYRAFTYAWLSENQAPGKALDDDSAARLAQNNVKIEFDGQTQIVFLNGKPLGDEIRTPEITASIKPVADHPLIRDRVNEIIREAAEKYSIVADGRDMGTVVFPDAAIKFFLTADLMTRAKRRHKEFQAKNPDITVEAVAESIAKRDRQDEARKHGALKPAKEAIFIDTTTKTLEEVLQEMEQKAKAVLSNKI